MSSLSVVSSDSHCLEAFDLLALLSSGSSGPGDGGSTVGGIGADVNKVSACSVVPLKKKRCSTILLLYCILCYFDNNEYYIKRYLSPGATSNESDSSPGSLMP